MSFQAAAANALLPNDQAAADGVPVVQPPQEFDVLIKRQGRSRRGNKHFFTTVLNYQQEYLLADRDGSPEVVQRAYQAWLDSIPPGYPPRRFLYKDKATNEWIEETNHDNIIRKVRDLLRNDRLVGARRPIDQRVPSAIAAAAPVPIVAAPRATSMPVGNLPPGLLWNGALGAPQQGLADAARQPAPALGAAVQNGPLPVAPLVVSHQHSPEWTGEHPRDVNGVNRARPQGRTASEFPPVYPSVTISNLPPADASGVSMAMNGPSPSQQGFLTNPPTSTTSGMPMAIPALSQVSRALTSPPTSTTSGMPMAIPALSQVSRAHAGTLPVNARGGSKYPPMVTPFSPGETVGLSRGQADLQGLTLPDLGDPLAPSLLPRAKHKESLRTLTQPFDESQVKKAPPMEPARRAVPVKVQIEHSPPMESWSKDHMKQAPMVPCKKPPSSRVINTSKLVATLDTTAQNFADKGVGDGAANMVSPDSQGQSSKEMWPADGYEGSPSPPRQKTTGLVAGDSLASLSPVDVNAPELFGDTDSLFSFDSQKSWATAKPPPSPVGGTGETQGSEDVDSPGDMESLLSFVRKENGLDYDSNMYEA